MVDTEPHCHNNIKETGLHSSFKANTARGETDKGLLRDLNNKPCVKLD